MSHAKQQTARRHFADDMVEHALVAQHAVNRFGDECAIVLTERVMLLEVTAQDAVRRILELEHEAERFRCRFEDFAGDAHSSLSLISLTSCSPAGSPSRLKKRMRTGR